MDAYTSSFDNFFNLSLIPTLKVFFTAATQVNPLILKYSKVNLSDFRGLVGLEWKEPLRKYKPNFLSFYNLISLASK